MNKNEKINLSIALIAIIISVVTLYFQFFYSSQAIRISIIDTSIQHDSIKLKSRIVYYNEGNKYATITKNNFYLYQKQNSGEDSGFMYLKNQDDEYDPIVLSPGEQILKVLSQNLLLENLDFTKYHINTKKNIQVALVINFLNDNGLQSETYIDIGWIHLNKDQLINKYHFDYSSNILHSNEYFIGADSR